MRVELIGTGSELVNGDIINLNTTFLASELRKMGFDIGNHTLVKDSLRDLQDSIQLALTRCDLLIITGGLGPTTDDITKNAIGNLLGLDLILHQPSLNRIEKFFAKRNTIMPKSNIQQALVPDGAIVLENLFGTAPGLVVEEKGISIILLPGPPFEMKKMFLGKVKHYIENKYKVDKNVFNQRIIKVGGIGESLVQDVIHNLKIDKEIDLSYRADVGEIIVKLSAKGPKGKEKVKIAEELITSKLKENIFSYDQTELEYIVGQKLLTEKLKIGIAESCTGGLLNHKLTNVPGSSSYLNHGIVSYSNEAKMRLLKVKPSTIEDFTPVSKETAMEMAQGVRNILNVDIGLSITGYAGGKPFDNQANQQIENSGENVGLVYIGLVAENFAEVKELHFAGDRISIKEMAAKSGLFMLWRYLENIKMYKMEGE